MRRDDILGGKLLSDLENEEHVEKENNEEMSQFP